VRERAVARVLLVLALPVPRVVAALLRAPAFVFVVPVRAAVTVLAARRVRLAAVWLRPVVRPRPVLMGAIMSASASIDVAVLPVRLLPARGLLRDRAADVLGLRIPVASSDVSLA